MITSIIATLAVAQGGFQPLPPTYQFFTGDAFVYASGSPRWRNAVWPGSGAADHDRVPDAVWEDRDMWVQRTIKPEWVPSDMRARTMAFRQYCGNDVLAFRYRKGEYDVQVMEMLGLVTLAIKGPNAIIFPTDSASINAHVKGTLARFLNLSVSELAKISIDGSFITDPPDTMYSFLVESSVPPLYTRPWWMLHGITDGCTVFISMHKSLDEHQTFGQKSSAGNENIGVRFLPDR